MMKPKPRDNSFKANFMRASAALIVPILIFGSPLLYLYILVSSWYGFSFCLLYAAYIYWDESHEEGGYSFEWFRNGSLFKWYADYHPAKIVKEADLDPTRNYIFGYHPHGLLAMGAYTNLALNATGFDSVFPGIKNRVLALRASFYIPFNREYYLRGGVACCSKRSINNILRMGPGHSCTLVVGGAAEVPLGGPGKATLVLKNRLGFVKMALENGADLVPVFGFGENHLVSLELPKPGTFSRKIQDFIKHNAGFYFPYYRGRLPFIEGFGLMFRQVPLVTVGKGHTFTNANIAVGKPIHVTKDINPSIEKIKELHDKYVKALVDLYDRNKYTYHPESSYPVPDLIIQ
ncbi:diacylglycerol O-acyltransferase 1 [Entomophthora muscae]|uniref:Diacylglycerol O-acyltransferase 1 n=1 Tax=Entomophthora muscae TaxID=34485 RepID=A0ACC2SZL1_9FUNG|nr:diacylglycerol O-acyltransferase 1 [Entomophthora muscae]